MYKNNTLTLDFVKYYLGLGFSVIPLKSKQPRISWSEFQKRIATEEEVLKWFSNGGSPGVGIVTGSISKLVVIDADTHKAIEFLEQFGELKKTARVKTKRGQHYYFRIPDLPADFGSQKVYKDQIRIDIKANGGYVVAPPSLVDGHVYTWLGVNETEIGDTIKSLSFFAFQELLSRIKLKLGLEQDIDEKAELEKTKNILDVDLKKLGKVIKKYYREGNRQNIAIYTAAMLAKLGYDLDTTIAFINEIANSCNDTELKMRIAGIRHTFEKYESNQPVKGITGLLELGISEEELKKAFISIEPEETQTIRVIIPTVTELLKEFCKEHGFKIDYDEFYVKIFINDKEISREVEIYIQSELERQINKRIPDDVFQKAIESIAYENKRDRLKEFLMKCKSKCDGVPRIHTFFYDVFGTPITQYSTTVSKNFFVAAVARALNPGCFQKNIVVIQGPQNIGKSRALMALGKEFHREINVSITTEKDFYMAIQGVWLAEIPEMDALRKAERNRIKAVISSTVDRFRPPYSRHMKDFPRRCVFTCTTNDQTIYDDPTGGTRFWVIEARKNADIEYIEKYREQLFGEAVWEFEKGYKYWEIDEQEAKEVQENVRRHDEWEQIISEYIVKNNTKVITVTEVAEKVLNVPLKDLDKSKQMRMAECLLLLGFSKKTIREGSKTRKVWIRNQDTIDTQDTSDEPNEPF